MQYFHFKQNKNQYTFHSRSKVRRQSFSDRKSQNVSCNTTTPTYNARHVGFRMLLFFPKQNRRLKIKQCTTRWLLNGFVSHEMFDLLF